MVHSCGCPPLRIYTARSSSLINILRIPSTSKVKVHPPSSRRKHVDVGGGDVPPGLDQMRTPTQTMTTRFRDAARSVRRRKNSNIRAHSSLRTPMRNIHCLEQTIPSGRRSEHRGRGRRRLRVQRVGAER